MIKVNEHTIIGAPVFKGTRPHRLNVTGVIAIIFLKDGQCASGTVVLLLPHIACLGDFLSSNNE